MDQVSGRSGEPLSKATLYATLKALRAFFEWLSQAPGYRSRVNFSDAEFFNLTANDARIARAERERPAPSLEQINHVLSTMSAATVIERRDRALVAFTLITGARDSATASFRLSHVDVAGGLVVQDARVVRTKRRKTFITQFFPVSDEALQIVMAWIHELTTVHFFGPNDPLFPATRVRPNAEGLFTVEGLERVPWSNAGPIRTVFKRAFTEAGLPSFNPHSFRKTLALLGERRCSTPEEFKAWSQNLGHEGVLTTFSSYGEVSSSRQAEIIAGLGAKRALGPDAAAVARVLDAAKASLLQGV